MTDDPAGTADLRWRRRSDEHADDWYGYEPGATVALVRLERWDRTWRARVRAEPDVMFTDPDLPGGWHWTDAHEPQPHSPPGYNQPITDTNVARLKARVAAGYTPIAEEARGLIAETHTLDQFAADEADRAVPRPRLATPGPAAAPGFGDRMLELAAQVAAAPDDAAALATMRTATGLTITDPAADRTELDRRAEANTRAAAAWLAAPPRLHWSRDGAGLRGGAGGTTLFMVIGRPPGEHDRLISCLPGVGPRPVRADDEAKVLAEWELGIWLARLFGGPADSAHPAPPPLTAVCTAANFGDPLPAGEQ